MNKQDYNVLLIEDDRRKISTVKDVLEFSPYPEVLEKLDIVETLEDAKKRTQELLGVSDKLVVILDSYFPDVSRGDVNEDAGLEYVEFLLDYIRDNPAYIHLILNILDTNSYGSLQQSIIERVSNDPAVSYDSVSDTPQIFMKDFSDFFGDK